MTFAVQVIDNLNLKESVNLLTELQKKRIHLNSFSFIKYKNIANYKKSIIPQYGRNLQYFENNPQQRNI
jgi:hypothetical protein